MIRNALSAAFRVPSIHSAAAAAIGSRLENLERRYLYAAAAESHWYDYYVSGESMVSQSLAGAMSAASAAGKTTTTATASAAPKAPPLHRPGAPDLQPASDDGKSNRDDVTSVTSPWFDVAKVDASVTLQLLRDGVVVASVASGAGGAISIQDAGPVPAGVHEYTARVMNASTGAVSDASNGLKVTFQVNTPPPPAAPAAPDLQPASDTGSSNGDNVTAANSPVFTINGVQGGLTVRLLRDGVIVASGVAAGSSVSLQDATAGADGGYAYTAVAVDGFNQTSAASGSLIVTIDRTAPTAAGTPDLVGASDSGASNSDNVTAVASPTFTVSGLEIGATVELMRDGVVVASGVATGGSMTVQDPSVLASGGYAYAARQRDAAGNTSAAGGTLTITIDVTAPSAPAAPDLAAASDTGASNSDNLTASVSPSFSVTGAEVGATVQLLRDGVVVASGVASATGTVSLSDAAAGNGNHAYTARVTDLAGNVGASSAALNVTIDTAAPAMPAAPDLRASDDTGSSSTDNITAHNSGITFDIAGVESGASVELLRDGVVIASGIATSGSIALADSATLADGSYHYTARQTDLAGNVSLISGMTAVTVDTTAPTSSVSLALADAGDTGIKGDDVTTLRRPVFDITNVDAGATVQLLCDGVVVATGVASGTGVTLQSSIALSAGTHTFTARQVDAAGNPAPGASDPATVRIVNALATSDFDGDGISDPAVYTGGV